MLASKTNETNVAIVHNHNDTTTKTSGSDDSTTIETKSKYFLPAKVRQTNKGTNIMTSLLEFFTHDWSLSLKHIFAAEWGVFVVRNLFLSFFCLFKHSLDIHIHRHWDLISTQHQHKYLSISNV